MAVPLPILDGPAPLVPLAHLDDLAIRLTEEDTDATGPATAVVGAGMVGGTTAQRLAERIPDVKRDQEQQADDGHVVRRRRNFPKLMPVS